MNGAPSAGERNTTAPTQYAVKVVRGPFIELSPHGLACTTEEKLDQLIPSLDRPLAADLFCGAGGLSLGLTEAGFDVVLGVDHDDDALDTHRAHHPGLSVNWDMADPANVERVAEIVERHGISLVAGGPPCQPFSRAGRSIIRDLVRVGKRDSHDHRRDLWESFLGVIELSRPEAVLMENVPDMALDRGMVILRAMIERLERLDYSVDCKVVETWRYGVPQHRQRFILVALRNRRLFAWPTESAQRVTLDNAIVDLPAVEGGWRPDNGDGEDPVASGWADYEEPRTAFQQRAREFVPEHAMHRIYDHITRPVREDDAKAFAQMTPETRYSDLDPELKRYRDDIFDDKYKRLDPHKVSRTITAHIAKDGYWYIHPYQDRTLTVREAARLQTFRDHIRFAGSPTSAFRQIGNAVPVELGRRLGTTILESLEAAEPIPASTTEIANTLAVWFNEQAHDPVTLSIPWLGAETRWTVISAELLWARISADRIRSAWAAVRGLETPAQTLDALPMLRRLATAWGRTDQCDQLEECASWFMEHPDHLDAGVTADELREAPHVSQSIADLASRVVPGDTEDPVLASRGVLRVAARFTGQPVDEQNRRTDGRLAVARLIGGRDNSHEAHLALIDIANEICGPGIPNCGICPLEPWCAEAKFQPKQPMLDFTNPTAQQPTDPGPSVAR